MRRLFPLLMVAMLVGASGALAGLARPQSASAADCLGFPETGHQVCGRFLTYWQEHGGLAQQGYPLSEPFLERSTIDSRYYQVQYFERAVFEWHQENDAPNDVLLTQLGREALLQVANIVYKQLNP